MRNFGVKELINVKLQVFTKSQLTSTNFYRNTPIYAVSITTIPATPYKAHTTSSQDD
jgi:hypothetical protein